MTKSGFVMPHIKSNIKKLISDTLLFNELTDIVFAIPDAIDSASYSLYELGGSIVKYLFYGDDIKRTSRIIAIIPVLRILAKPLIIGDLIFSLY